MFKTRPGRRIPTFKTHWYSKPHTKSSISSFGSIRQILIYLIGAWFIISLLYYLFIFVTSSSKNESKPTIHPSIKIRYNDNDNDHHLINDEIDKIEINIVETMRINNAAFGHPNKEDMPNPCIVILTFNRAQSLKRTVDSLKSIEGITSYQIYISQDGNDMATTNMIRNQLKAKYYKDDDVDNNDINIIKHIQHEQATDVNEPTEKLAVHYKYMFSVIFDELNHSHAIILEDDMIFSADFLEYFASTVYLLNNDENDIFCISSWNDYGQQFLNHDVDTLYRTDYFPGLGWLLKKSLWNEISSLFPNDHWDHFMRLDIITKNRDCIYPDLSRNYNIGEIGSTMDSVWYQQYLKPMQFNENSNVKFKEIDLSYLAKNNYETYIINLIKNKSKYVGEYPKDQHLVRDQINTPNTNKYGDTLLIAYHGSNWWEIAETIGVLTTQRTKHKNTIIIKKNDVMYIFANIRLSPYLKYHNDAQYAVNEQNLNMKIITGNTGESCTTACRQQNMQCLHDHFEYINLCSVLQKHFQCEAGCLGGIVGEDVPNYVTQNKPGLYQKCLTTEITPTCSAQHPTTARLCPCA